MLSNFIDEQKGVIFMEVTDIDNDFTAAMGNSGIYPFRLGICLYLADGFLVDAGSGLILKKVKKFLSGKKVNCVGITHVHEDHTGAAAWIKDEFNVPVYIHEASIEEAISDSSVPLYRKLTWGNRKGFAADPMPEYIETEKYRFDVIDAPGHHPHHVVFHEKNKGWLFTGDLYVSRKQAVAFKDENISQAITSFERIVKLDFDTVFCGHSGVQKNGKSRIIEKLNNYIELRERVRALEKKGMSREEIDRELFPGKNLWSIVSGGEWSSLNMVKTV
jgi:glyoxylase-like metal-dependent hydrolase (beta-lactamase superfamily II)